MCVVHSDKGGQSASGGVADDQESCLLDPTTGDNRPWMHGRRSRGITSTTPEFGVGGTLMQTVPLRFLSCRYKGSVLPSKYAKIRFRPGLCPADPAGELTTLPQTAIFYLTRHRPTFGTRRTSAPRIPTRSTPMPEWTLEDCCLHCVMRCDRTEMHHSDALFQQLSTPRLRTI